MNIIEAKKQIKNAIKVYFSKDEFGEYIIPIHKQRPIFLMGPPGVGKTAIMEQIASELRVGLISYSMTHHTRQSALGLPFIVKKNYDGIETEVSQYTMSEIIASVYDMIQKTGHKEGILFLDEINCVSETLAPAMLQFLQYKTFGMHKVPNGWIVVTAGNPPEYNNSVREFDIVTWDRLKRVNVEPDFNAWKEYAYEKRIHPSIMSFLEIDNFNFYSIESTVDGKAFITARGWDDLSTMIKLYEKQNIEVDINLCEQYIQSTKIAKKFSHYYNLFKKYVLEYKIDNILDGEVPSGVKKKAINAKFDERMSLVSLLLDAISTRIDEIDVDSNVLKRSMDSIKKIKFEHMQTKDFDSAVHREIERQNQIIKKGELSSSISSKDITVIRKLIKILQEKMLGISISDQNKIYLEVANKLKDYQTNVKSRSTIVKKQLSNAFIFLESVFGSGQEMLIFVTELTTNKACAQFINQNGCEEYFKHNKQLLFYERKKDLIDQMNLLDIDFNEIVK